MNRMDRLLGYLVLLQSRGLLRAQDLAARFEVSERTVYRDIQLLCEVGVPVVALPGEGYRLAEGYSLPPIVFSEQEARALFLSVSLLSGVAEDSATRRQAAAALEKVRAVLPRGTVAQLEALSAVFGFYTVGRWRLNFDDERLALLQYAVQERRVAHLRYHSPQRDAATERDVEPLQLAFVDGIWLLTAHCRLRRAQRNFRLDRIDRLALRQERFAAREIAPMAQRGAQDEVLLRVDAAAARWVRERQHYSFVEERPGEGDSVLMLYRVRPVQQIAGWVLGWGGQAEVLQPPELRAAVAEAAARIAEQHA